MRINPELSYQPGHSTYRRSLANLTPALFFFLWNGFGVKPRKPSQHLDAVDGPLFVLLLLILPLTAMTGALFDLRALCGQWPPRLKKCLFCP